MPLKLPNQAYLGFSAHTGELSDNFDIIDVQTKNLYQPRSGSSPKTGQRASSYERSSSSGGGWLWFFFKIILFIGVCAGGYFGYVSSPSRRARMSWIDTNGNRRTPTEHDRSTPVSDESDQIGVTNSSTCGSRRVVRSDSLNSMKIHMWVWLDEARVKFNSGTRGLGVKSRSNVNGLHRVVSHRLIVVHLPNFTDANRRKSLAFTDRLSTRIYAPVPYLRPASDLNETKREIRGFQAQIAKSGSAF